ncbi:thiolase family protein [Glaciimonas sp. CA11.2]|uniref:thiolase family protein n=1 Tax=unclassified Glaciimonas TaxID=2644401 RepID=UPI002AB3D1CC|nr:MULTISPECIES: thiolase family protein [unclassified Glaciimonas]MDY7546877.1 thiolase family protein [Glaciimonas sp. CA11.2]MEB0012346.1 thiolase family protein [Glaciimonas sp. Cout2]MEB0080468.1 thiolase family protein [Glaciimonas sp. Gout2]MEB0161919.1 thiolase family protein [Glaciimonas sp. CA11.2]
MREKAVIAGIGQTAFGKLEGRSTLSMNVEAVSKALTDAGIDKSMVDGLFVKCPTSRFEMMYAQKLAESMGIMPRIGGVWDQGGASSAGMIGYAAMAIEAGQCEIALVCLADNPKTGSRQAYEKAWGDDGLYGWFGTPAGYAMIARRHMGEFGTTSDQLGAIAVACRKHGAANPHAQLRKPLTLDQYRESKMIAAPLRRDDCCLVSDGGAAVVVMSAERARQLGVPKPVPILGFGQGQTSWEVEQRPDLTSTEAVISARAAFKMAGLSPKDIDVAQIYDCFTITALMTLEDYGFCAKGEGGHFVEDGRIEIGGDLPINTAGGLLSETGMPGMQLVLEGVRQMRGDASTQVKNARTCAISNQGGIMHTHSTLILGQ